MKSARTIPRQPQGGPLALAEIDPPLYRIHQLGITLLKLDEPRIINALRAVTRKKHAISLDDAIDYAIAWLDKARPVLDDEPTDTRSILLFSLIWAALLFGVIDADDRKLDKRNRPARRRSIVRHRKIS